MKPFEQASTTASKEVPRTEAIKNVSKEVPTNISAEFIPLTEAQPEDQVTTKTSLIPDPEPIQKPQLPTKTKVPEITTNDRNIITNEDEPQAPKPVSRPEPPIPTGGSKTIPGIPEPLLPVTTDSSIHKEEAPRSNATENIKSSVPEHIPITETVSRDSTGTDAFEEATNDFQEERAIAQPSSNGKELPEYSIGFFATVLHVITQFFRRWFSLNSE